MSSSHAARPARSSLVVRSLPVSDIPTLSPHEWRNDVLLRVAGGARPVTLYGRPAGERVVVTAILEEGPRRLAIVRTEVEPATGFASLTSQVPAFHCFERELHEQHRVHLEGHPWLKPIRYEGGTQADMSDYPFFKIESKEVHEVAVGPIHAGVIEPGSFRFMCLGEDVHHLEIHLGYQHRGVEALLLRKDPRRLAPLVETIAGDTSIAHTWAYAAAIEQLAGVAPSLSVEAARAILLELERVAMHLATLTGLAADVGFLQGATSYGRLRTTAINTTMALCGSRFGRTAVKPGRSDVALPAPALEELSKALALLEHNLPIINDRFLTSRTVRHRLESTGTVSEETARELGLVGVTARACGVPLDQRQEGGGIYDLVPVAHLEEHTGDCQARASLRIAEIDVSLRFLRAVLAAQEIRAERHDVGPLQGSHLVVSVAEGFRGEVVHCLETDAAGALAHYKVQDPSLRNWMGLALAVRGNEISDFPICNKSFDLSYCGNDL